MLGTVFLASAFLTATVLCQQFAVTGYRDACKKIERTVSSASQLFYPGGSSYHIIGRPNTSPISIIDTGSIGSPGFEADISHWANSSSQVSACSVEPGTPQDVGLIVNTVIIIYPCRLIDVTPRECHSFANSPRRARHSQSRVVGTLSIADSRRLSAYTYH